MTETTAFTQHMIDHVACNHIVGRCTVLADQAKTMTCDVHRDGVVHYRPVYGSFECHVYRERVLFTHVIAEV